MPLASPTPRPLDIENIRAVFDAGAPFRHVIIDDFFEEADAHALHRAFPTFRSPERAKARLFSGRVYGAPPKFRAPVINETFDNLARRSFANVLSRISGIEPLAMDETHAGGGAHVGLPGSVLPVHADHNTHPQASWLYRRLNLLVYLNPNWNASWKSNLLLYDETGSRKLVDIETRFNRAVLMEVSDRAFHGYRSLEIPRDETRQLLTAYYYSPTPGPNQGIAPHGTIFGNPADLSVRDRAAIRVRHALLRRFEGLFPRPSWSDDGAPREQK